MLVGLEGEVEVDLVGRGVDSIGGLTMKGVKGGDGEDSIQEGGILRLCCEGKARGDKSIMGLAVAGDG